MLLYLGSRENCTRVVNWRRQKPHLYEKSPYKAMKACWSFFGGAGDMIRLTAEGKGVIGTGKEN